ncbi:MAG TPA: rod shape-determining protein MreD [Streptosporangiaceae bacterium]|jgi:rod shape-determining protein MreD
MKRLLIVAVALAAALLVQLTIVNGLALPGGGAPDLVLLCVVAIGLTGGPQAGLIAGFCAGLALDLAPPANQLIGQYALVFCLVGYACGRLRFTLTRSAVLAMASAAGVAVAGEVLVACLVLVLDTPQVTLATVAQVLPSTVVYDLVLSPVFLFAGVRIAVGLGVNFNPLDDSPALEIGGSAQPTGLADLVRARRLRRATGTDGVGVASGAWLTGDSAADVAAMGTVGWLSGPPTSRRARREQSRLTAALTGAAPRKGSFWVGSKPAGLRPTEGSAPAQQSGLRKLRPESGVAGTAARAGMPARLSGTDGADLRGAAFEGSGSGGLAGRGWVSGGANMPKIAFGTGGLTGAGRAAGKGVPKIAFKKKGPIRPAGGGAGTSHLNPSGEISGGRVGGGTKTPKIAFGTGGLPGSGRSGGRGTPKIAFGSGLGPGLRAGTGRPARLRFRSASTRSASGTWLAGSRTRSLGGTGPRDHVRVPGSNYRAGGSYRPKTPRGRSWRRRRVPRWLSWPWQKGGTR